jgi:hypothetical protein
VQSAQADTSVTLNWGLGVPLGILARPLVVATILLPMRYREYIRGVWESGSRKRFQYLALFCFLVVIYAIYLAMHLGVIHAGTEPDSLFGPLAKISLISALPFAVLAYSDKGWGSNDAAPVCLAAWITVCVGLSFRCKICALGLATVFFPFIFSALLAHGFGTLCRFAKDRAH